MDSNHRLLATAVLLACGVARTDAAATMSDPWEACARAVDQAERAAGIPDHLLAAISLAESGRRNAERRERIAWPWTVMAERRGQFFPTKADAIAHVRALSARGVRNIDVGCMQVNLKYHPDAFADLSEAFDPAANAAYAARYLSGLRRETGSWLAAAGRYHSATPAYGRPYRAKVARIWHARKDAGAAQPETAAAPEVRTEAAKQGPTLRRSRPVPVARLLGRPRTLFTARGATPTARGSTAEQRFAANRMKQLAAWRRSRQRQRPH